MEVRDGHLVSKASLEDLVIIKLRLKVIILRELLAEFLIQFGEILSVTQDV